jgi:hypothetical protein
MKILGFLALWGLTLVWAEDFSFLENEKLQYEISYGFIDAGDAIIETSPTNDPDVYKIEARAKSKGVTETFFEVRDTVRTFVNKETLLPSSFLKILNEGGWHNRIHIDIGEETAHLRDTVFTDPLPDGEVKRFTDTTVTLDGPTHNIISAFFLFRTLDLSPDSEHVFFAVSGKKKYRLKVIVHGIETVEVEAGEFECLKIEPILDDDGLFKAKGKMFVYLTNDARRIPVLVESAVLIGSIDVSLTKYQAPSPKNK